MAGSVSACGSPASSSNGTAARSASRAAERAAARPSPCASRSSPGLEGLGGRPARRACEDAFDSSVMARVLVIDDEPDVRAVIQEMLEAGGHQAVLAANGVEGLEAHHRLPADVVVTDLFMPEKEGFETIDQL